MVHRAQVILTSGVHFMIFSSIFSVLVFGDSHIERIRGNFYGASNIWDMKPWNVTCLGVPGLKTRQCPEYLVTVLEMQPELIIIPLGGNDTSIHPRFPWLAHNSAAGHAMKL